jgi:hypothetical protein
LARVGPAWSLVSGSGKTSVSAAAPTSFCNQKALAGSVEIPELFRCAGVVDHGADGYHYAEILAILTVPVGPFPMPSPPRVKNTVVPELQQGVHVLSAYQGDITAPATVAPAGSATRHELFPTEGHTAISALAAGNLDLGFVNEHVECTAP